MRTARQLNTYHSGLRQRMQEQLAALELGQQEDDCFGENPALWTIERTASFHSTKTKAEQLGSLTFSPRCIPPEGVRGDDTAVHIAAKNT